MSKSATAGLVTAASVVNQLCDELKYTRPHIINIMKSHRRMLGAQKKAGRWKMPETSVEMLKQLVIEQSGRRYKLGEIGPH